MRRVISPLVVVAALALAGCAGDGSSVSDQAKAGDRKGYVSGDGSVERIPAADRGEPVALEGDLIDGGKWSLATDAKDKVTVVNVWASWCGPCKAEAPHLEKAWTQLKAKDIAMVGIDFKEGPERGLAAAKTYGMTFPSLSDPSGVLVLAFKGKVATTPATIVLDKDGRVAARINGPITTPSTLTGLVDDVVAAG
ncbi:TlpA family protein disulfide reductase [Actinomycetota bacterium]